MPLRKAKDITQSTLGGLHVKLPKLIATENVRISAKELDVAREYIDKYWQRLTTAKTKDEDSLVGLPKPYLVPAYEKGHEFDFDEMYYWDSYFMIQDKLDAEHKELVMGILENLTYMFKRFGIIPNASRTYLMGRSNPPLLTSLIFDIHQAYDPGKEWLAKQIEVAKKEYTTVWMGKSKPYAHQVYEGLSRYYDINYLHNLAEAESGWDYTTRFSGKCMNFLPVDLNALLYKYETDFAAAADILGDKHEAEKWRAVVEKRQKIMNRLMWNDFHGFYFDYDYTKETRGQVVSLAGYYPMWAGMVTEKQAAKMVKYLRRLERRGGLVTTDGTYVDKLLPGSMPTQWAYPNGWAPLHFIVVKGLQRYGYHDDARRIALKWLRTNMHWFKKHHVFLEKYNVVSPTKPPQKGVYPSQTGFGWTNAVFERFCQEFIDQT